MKLFWTEPAIEVETFLVESVITTSSNNAESGDFEPEKPGYEGPIIPI